MEIFGYTYIYRNFNERTTVCSLCSLALYCNITFFLLPSYGDADFCGHTLVSTLGCARIARMG